MHRAFALLSEGTVLGDRYRIERTIAQGGLGVVYEATDLSATGDGRVAIKTVKPERLGDARAIERFRRECEIARLLEHPNIVRLLDLGMDGGSPFLVLELVHGETLRTRLERDGALAPSEVARILRCVAAAIDHAHGQGVIHRDIKPSNILVDDERVLLADFGLARAMEDTSLSSLTDTSTVVGTMSYASPEQVRGEAPTAQSDLYSLGVTLFECLTGRLPFAGDTPLAQATARLTTVPLRVREVRPDVPKGLDGALARCLSRAASGRPRSAAEVVEEFTEGLARPHPVRRLVRVAVVILLAAASLWGMAAVWPRAHAFWLERTWRAGVEPRVRQIADMRVGRDSHTVTALHDGNAFIAGGVGTGGSLLDSTETFDTIRGVFREGPHLRIGRRAHTATLLNANQVLIVGGNGGPKGETLKLCELFDVDTNSMVAAPEMSVPRNAHTATPLPDGSILVAGGGYASLSPLDSTEIFDAATRIFHPGPRMTERRFFHTAAALQDGRVLVAGGWGGPGIGKGELLSSAELFDPSEKTFRPVGRMTSLRYAPTMTTLLDGRVLVSGGVTRSNTGLQTAEVFDPKTLTFSSVGPMTRERYFHQSVLLRSGRVVIAGGETPQYRLTPTVEIFDPERNLFRRLGPMKGSRWSEVGVRLGDGSAFFAGGREDETRLRTAEVVEE